MTVAPRQGQEGATGLWVNQELLGKPVCRLLQLGRALGGGRSHSLNQSPSTLAAFAI